MLVYFLMSIFDKFRAFKLSVGRTYRRIKGGLYSGLTSMSGFSSLVPQRLVIEPHDLHTADPLIAQEFYNGHYALGNVIVETQGQTPFSIVTDNDDWEKELHSFTWLRHFSANKDTLSDSHARSLVKEWIELKTDQLPKHAWDIEIASKRLISLLCHSIVILSKPDHEFHYQLMRALGRHVKIIRRLIANASEGMPVLYGHIALTYASICFSGNSTSLNAHRDRLAHALDRQILADGGHISRNPAVIPKVLGLLLPLKEGFAAIETAPPKQLITAIERLLPALKFFRHGDGTMARFNGVGVTEKALVTTLLRYDESLGEPVKDAVHSGYQRTQIGDALMVVDTGEPPKGELSLEANGGVLSFEFSSGLSCLIVNCGKPQTSDESTSQVWRTTNAHSTVTLNDVSTVRFENPGTAGRAISGQVFSRNLNLEYAREDSFNATTITAAHSGYVKEFGIRHQRSLTLDENGNRLLGQEWFTGPNKSDMRYTTKDKLALRFHLHPDIKASLSANGETCLMETREGEQWRFDCPGFKVELAESIFFAGLPAPKPTWQIVIHTKAYDNPEINWALQKIQAKETS